MSRFDVWVVMKLESCDQTPCHPLIPRHEREMDNRKRNIQNVKGFSEKELETVHYNFVSRVWDYTLSTVRFTFNMRLPLSLPWVERPLTIGFQDKTCVHKKKSVYLNM